MTHDWFFSRRWLAIKFALVLTAGVAFHIIAFRDLDDQREHMSARGFDSGRLEVLSRLEKEFHQVFDKAEKFVEGDANIDDVKLALDIFWSRVGAGADKRRLQMYADQQVDIAVLGEVRDSLPDIEAAIKDLRLHDVSALARLEKFHDKFAPSISDFSDSAYAARVRVIQNNSAAQWNLFEALRKYQIAFSLYGAGLLLFLLAEVAWANRAAARLRRSVEANQLLADTDALTGLHNRRRFDQELAQRSALPASGRPLSAIAIDIDRFRAVNDSFGHAVGDQLLVEVAGRLREVCDAAFITRMSSDEFIVLVETDSVRQAERIRNALRRPVNIGDRLYKPSASIAIVDGIQGKSPGDIVQSANATMLVAKARGSGQIVQFEDAMLQSIRERAVIDADLTEAISHGDIHIVVQPKVTIADRSVHGFEALARWQHPDLGWISPETFCSIADATGRSSTLGLGIADLALEFTATARRAGHDGRMSINVSPAFGSHPTFVPDMLALLAHHGLDASDIEFEVTEEAMLSDASAVRDNMMAMRALGAAVAIDDFGKGHSNMSRLTKLAVTVIKVDKTVIGEGVDMRSSRAIIKGLVELARELEIELLVEGVETEEQAHTLMELGVLTAQGYLFARPMPPLKLLAWLAEEKRPLALPAPKLAVA